MDDALRSRPSPATRPLAPSTTRRRASKRRRCLLGPERLERRELLTTQVTLGSLLLDGNFSLSGSSYAATGPVEIGFSPTSTESYTPLSIWSGDLSFTSGGSSFTFDGTIQGIAQSSDITIAQIAAAQTISVESLTSSGVSCGGGSPVNVFGASLTPDSIALIDPAGGDTTASYVSLQGSLGIAQLPGLSIPVSGTNFAQIDPGARSPGLTLVASTTSSPFSAFGVNLTPASVSVGFSTALSEFQISGSIAAATSSGDFSLSGSLGTPSAPGLVIDDTGTVTQLAVAISSNVTTHGLTIGASGLTFDYQPSASNEYTIQSGTISVSDSSNDFSFQGQLDSTGGPGVVITNGSLASLDATVSSSATLKGMTLTVDDLAFSYENNASSIYNGAFTITQGSVTFSTSAGDTSFAAQFGSGPNVGLVIDNGSLSSLYATVSSTISAQDLTLTASGVVFQYEGSSSSFEIATGSVAISNGPIQFASATFGASGVPGLSIKNGVLTGLDISISSTLSVSGMDLGISQLQFVYETVSGQTFGNFQIAAGGSVSLSAGPSDNTLSFQGTFGTSQNGQSVPGLSISDGVLQSFYIGVSYHITLGGSLTLSTTGLTFSYESASATFQIPSGSVSVVDTSGDFDFTGTFGGTLSNGTTGPGLVVTNGSLSALNVSVTSQLTAAALTLNVTNLDFVYNAGQNQYEIDSGSLSFKTSEGFSFSATFGLPSPSDPSTNLPGLVIVDGALTEFNATLTSSFTVAGLVISVDDMAMSYVSKNYEMYGTVNISTANVQFSGTIGQPSASPPVYGLVISNNALKSLAITINSNVTFGSLTVQAENLSFNYDASPESFTLYGNVTTSIAGVTLQGNLGTQSLPGLSIVNGQLTELNLGVTANFSLFDLQCNVQDLTFQYQATDGNTDYILYGGLTLSVSGNTFSATLGTSTNPGLVIQNSVVEQINMSISGSFQISGFGFQIDNAGLDYTATNDEYLIFGTFTLSDVFSASVQLGTGSTNPGITIINGVFQLDQFAFSLDNVPIGAFTLNYVDISYNSTGDVWSGAASVTFPTGWAVAASMTFVNGNLDDISLSYSAGTSSGIAIPDTGMFVTSISASLQNLDEPASIIVSGSIDAVFGKQINIGGTSCAIFAATGSFTADSQQLELSGSYYEGAYETNGKWNGVLGTGTASVDLDWASGVYTASMSESLYDGIFKISASAAFDDSGDFGIIATASVNVPNGVPFIGGTQLGSMSFAFIYTASSNTGTVAAWTTVNCLFTTVTTGFQYTFDSGSTGDFSLIGAGGVSSIESSFNSISSADTSTPPTYVYNYSVTVPSGSGANGVSVQAMWPSNTGTHALLISGPNDNGTYYSLTSSKLPSTDDFLTSYTTSTTQSVLSSGSATSTSVLLPPGTYDFEVQSSYEFSSTSDVTFTNQLYYEAPTVAIASVPTSALAFVPTLTGFAAGALAANTTVTLYAGTSNTGTVGKEVGSFAYSVGSNGNLQNVPSIDLSSYSPGVPIYIYAVINDGVNTAVYSGYSAPIIPVPNLIGKVADQFGNPIAGIRVFLDLNNDQNYDAPVIGANGTVTKAGDPSVISNLAGAYYFNNLESYSATDIGYSTFRVMAVMPSPSFTPITPANDVDTLSLSTIAPTASSPTPSLQANFTINRLASISGSLYSDLVQNGVYVSSDPSLAGATVYLDANNNGVYDASDPTCVTGPSGTYGFYDLTPNQYTTGILTSTTSGNVTTNSYVVTQPTTQTYTIPIANDAQQLSGYVFGVISLATLGGTITSQLAQGSTTTSLAGALVDASTPIPGAVVPNYSSFSSTSGLSLVGASESSSKTLTMLASTQSAAATAAWFATPIAVTGGFETSFQWSMTSSSATSGGLAFVIQEDGTASLGSTAYGYGGLKNSLAVILDAVDNEVLIEAGGNTSSSSAIAVLTSEQLGFSLASGSLYTTRITYLPSNSGGLGSLNVYLSGDSTSGLTPVLSASVNLASVLNLGSSTTADFGFTAGTAGTGLAASVGSWTLTALQTQTTTTDSQGNYTFTGLMPKSTYTVSQVVPDGYVQATPSNTLGVYSQSSIGSPGIVASSMTTGDFNGDGIADVAYATTLASGAGFQIAYAYGTGTGGFGAPVIVNLPLTLTAPKLATPSNGSKAFDATIVAGDFGTTAHDDIAYIATMAKGGDVIVVYDILAGKVISEVEVESSAVAPTSSSNVAAGYGGTTNNVAVGDLNNDGLSDLAVSTFDGVYTLVSIQDLVVGSSWTVNPPTLATPLGKPALVSSAVGYNGGVALADFNGDGNLDLVSVGVQYVPTVTKSDGETIDSWTNMTVDSTIQLAYGSGNGVNFTAQTQTLFQSYSSSNIDAYFSSNSSYPLFPIPFGLAAADVSGDNVPDLVLNGYTSTLQPAVFLITQTAPGTFVGTNTITIPNGKSFNVNNTPGADNSIVAGSTTLPSQILAADINADGFYDVAAVDPNMGQMLLLTSKVAGLTTGQTQNLQKFGGGALPQFGLADFNLDGYADLLVPGANNDPSQTAPVLVLNGTINVGIISYTPSDAQVLTGQNFADINFGASPSAAMPAIAFAQGQSAAPALVHPVAGTGGASLVGRVFFDRNGNARYNARESSGGGLVVYLDLNKDGVYDQGDLSTVTNNLGYYQFDGLTPGQTYTNRIANLPGVYYENPVTVTMPPLGRKSPLYRDLGVGEYWSVAQPALSVDPLTSIDLNLAPLGFRNSLPIKPFFQLIGTIPDGMTIDPYTGEIRWTPSVQDADATYTILVKVQNAADRSALQTQLNVVQVHVNAFSRPTTYVRDIFSDLLGRQPTPRELAGWTGLLQSGSSRSQFVQAIARTDAHYAIVTGEVYLTVLSRRPTAGELASALNLFHSGGDSDGLTRSLLTSPAFAQLHRSARSYVDAVNMILTFKTASKAVTAREVAWVKSGRSRAKLVAQIFRSHAATTAKANQLSSRYLGGTASSKTVAQWAGWLASGAQNTDSLTILILASDQFVNGVDSRVVAAPQGTNGAASAPYNRLNHLQSIMTGVVGSRSQLDALETHLYQGQTWKRVASGVYDGHAAFAARVQTQYQDLLHRSATAAEVSSLSSSLPSGNQIEALQVRLLASSEYRNRFGSTADYVNEAFRVLTVGPASSSVLRSWTLALQTGRPAIEMTQAAASSKSGMVDQIDRLYREVMLRDPSTAEVDHWLGEYQGSSPKDRSIALALANSEEFRQEQRDAVLVPTS